MGEDTSREDLKKVERLSTARLMPDKAGRRKNH
jgi:hypothetical protein